MRVFRVLTHSQRSLGRVRSLGRIRIARFQLDQRLSVSSSASLWDKQNPKEEEAGEKSADSFMGSIFGSSDSAEKGTADTEESPSDEAPKAEKSSEGTRVDAEGSPGILGFMKDVLLGAVGVEPSGNADEGTMEGRRRAQREKEYPWIAVTVSPKALERYGADGKKKAAEQAGKKDVVVYRNKFTGEVQVEKPADFDERSKSAKQLDTETTAIVVAREEKSRWQHYADMIGASPVLEMLKEAGEAAQKTSVGKAATEAANQVREAKDKVQDTWETSQSPIIYQASSAYDTMFGETEHARAMGRILMLDPGFDSGPEFVHEMQEDIIPVVVKALLRGDRMTLGAWMTDGCMERVNAMLHQREAEGVVVDDTLLGVNDVTIMGAKAPERGDPVILVSCMVQQIHCMTKKDEVVEGAEDEIRAVTYLFAMVRKYDPSKGGLVWQVDELTYSGGMLYL